MNEIVPRLMEQVIQDSAMEDSPSSSSPRGASSKRAHSPDQAQGPSQVPRTDAASASSLASDRSSVSSLPRTDQQELVSMFQKGAPVEVMLASYLQKRSSKEIRHVNQEAEQQ